jgi:hypothetical protein
LDALRQELSELLSDDPKVNAELPRSTRQRICAIRWAISQLEQGVDPERVREGAERWIRRMEDKLAKV